MRPPISFLVPPLLSINYTLVLVLSRPQVDACVLAFLRNRGNWNTQAHTGRIVVNYAAHSKNIRVSEQLGTLGRQRIHVHVMVSSESEAFENHFHNEKSVRINSSCAGTKPQ